MPRSELLDEAVNKYYDHEMSDSELLHFEANMALSNGVREYCMKQCYEYFKMTNSIKLVKMRSATQAGLMMKKFEKMLNSTIKIDIDIYTVFFKGIKESLRNFFLCFKGHNTQ